MPAFTAPARGAPTKDHLDWLSSMCDSVDRHSALAAGTEQVFLDLLTVADPLVLSTSIQYVGGTINDELHAAGASVVSYVHSGQIHQAIALAHSDIADAMLKSLLDNGPKIVAGLVNDNLFAVLGGVGSVIGSGASHAASTVAQSVVHSSQMIDAVHHAGKALVAADHMTAMEGLGAHVPVFTAVFAVVRETKLVADGHKTTGEALLHGAVDVAGKGLGAAAGAKAGGVAGLAVGVPFGAAVGVLIGAIGGAVVGGVGAKYIKETSLREAKAELDRRHTTYGVAEQRLAAAFTSAVGASLAARRDSYQSSLGSPPRLGAREVLGIIEQVRGSTVEQVGYARAIVDQARQLGESDESQLTRIESRLSQVDKALAVKSGGLGALSNVATAAETVPISGVQGLKHHARCAQAAKRLNKMADTNRRAVTRWQVAAVARYKTETKAVFDSVQQLALQFKSEAEQALAPVLAQQEVVRRELAKVDG
jgi:hypothetical protein